MISRGGAEAQRKRRPLLLLAPPRLCVSFLCLFLNTAAADEAPEIVNSLGMRFVRIPAGEFRMGSPADDVEAEPDEQPQHLVRIADPFYLGRCEITQREFQRVMGENPSWFSPDGGGRDL